MKLNVADRFILAGLVPENGNRLTMKLGRQAVKLLEFSNEEMAEFEIVNDEANRTRWNPQKSREVEIAITPDMFKMFQDKFEALDKEGKLTSLQAETDEKFQGIMETVLNTSNESKSLS